MTIVVQLSIAVFAFTSTGEGIHIFPLLSLSLSLPLFQPLRSKNSSHDDDGESKKASKSKVEEIFVENEKKYFWLFCDNLNELSCTNGQSIDQFVTWKHTPYLSLSPSLSLSVYLYRTLCYTLHACLLFNHVSGYTPTSSITILHRSRYGTYLANKSYCVLNTFHTNILSVCLSVCLSLSLCNTHTTLLTLISHTCTLFLCHILSLFLPLSSHDHEMLNISLFLSLSHHLVLTLPLNKSVKN